MHRTALAATDPHRLARAFLALGDDLAPELQRSLTRALTALAAALALAVAAPLTATVPIASKSGDAPAATLANSKAVLAAADDEDDDAN